MTEKKEESPQLRAMRARVEALKGRTYKSEERAELAELAREELAQHARLDAELSDLLREEADIALAAAKTALDDAHKSTPIDAVWSLEAFKLCGVGWLVLGPDDKGYAAEALKASGKLDGSGKYKIQEKNPDICRVVVGRACIAAPVSKDHLTRALMDAPEFVVACSERVKQLGGAVLQEVAGKSTS